MADSILASVSTAARNAESRRDSFAGMSAENLRSYAHELMKEQEGEQGKVFAVAAAGAMYVGDGDINARSLFDVIRDISEDAAIANSLAHVVDRLADLAAAREAEV